MAPNRTTTSSVSEALKERVGRLLPVAGNFSRKWSFTIPAEKARGERLFSESRLAAVRPAGEKVKAATLVTLQPSTPAREPTAWMHAPSQPLMRSLLSQFQTPTAPRRTSRFFRVWLLVRSPCRADHSAYFGLAKFYLGQPFQPSTGPNLEICLQIVNARFQCNRPVAMDQDPEIQPVESLSLNKWEIKFFPLLHRNIHRRFEGADRYYK